MKEQCKRIQSRKSFQESQIEIFIIYVRYISLVTLGSEACYQHWGYFYVTTRHKRVKLKHRCKSGTGVAGCPGSSSRQFGCIRTATHTQALSRVCLPPTHTHIYPKRDAMEVRDKRHPHNCNCIPGSSSPHNIFSIPGTA